LIATKCSPLGIGSDAAGSIRIPCSFCGIYGYAPTGKRVSLKRTINLRKHDLNVWREISCSYGPMGKSVDDLVLVMKCLFGKFTKLVTMWIFLYDIIYL
jgi:fatty acid amide hydrolase